MPMLLLYHRSMMRIKCKRKTLLCRVPDERTKPLGCLTVISESTAVSVLVSQRAAL